MSNSLTDLEKSGCFFVIGSNTTEAHPLIASRVLQARERGAKLIVADPRKIHLARFADIHVRQKPGTDVALINGIMHIIISEGWEDSQFVSERTEHYEELKQAVASFTPEKTAEITGVPTADIRRMAECYAKAESSAILYAMGITQHTTGTDNVKSLANLAMLCGMMGKEGGGVNPLRGQNNVQGACDMGALPNVYPAYQAVNNPDLQKKFEEAWGRPLPPAPGLTVLEMMEAAGKGELKALYILGENPLLSDPDINHVRESLSTLDLLVVQDIFLTETAELAHVVLPGVTFAEKDGTFTNTDRRVQRVRKAIDPVGNSRPDWQILAELLRRFDVPADYSGPADVLKEINSVAPSYAGIGYERIETEGIPWPCPTPDHPGTPILHREKFTRGKGLFFGIDFLPPNEWPDDEYPFILTTGRTYFQFHTGTMTRRSHDLEQEQPKGRLELNPGDARRLGIRDGGIVRVQSRRGTISVPAQLTDRVGPGVVFLPFHYTEAAANLLTNPARDPVAKIPEYKVCAVKLERTDLTEEMMKDIKEDE